MSTWKVWLHTLADRAIVCNTVWFFEGLKKLAVTQITLISFPVLCHLVLIKFLPNLLYSGSLTGSCFNRDLPLLP